MLRIWRLATCAQPNIPTPIRNGWILDSNFDLQPELSNAEPVPQICLDIVFASASHARQTDAVARLNALDVQQHVTVAKPYAITR